MSGRMAAALILSLLLAPPGMALAEEKGAHPGGDLPDLKALTRVPVAAEPVEAPAEEEAPPGLDEATWRKRFQNLRGRIDREERLLALKRAELYDKIEQGKTEKKPRRFAIEGFVINTEKKGEDRQFIDPLEREVYEREKKLEALKDELRKLEFDASVAGVPKAWRH